MRELLHPAHGRFVSTSLDDLIADDRNAMLLCERHHGLKTMFLIRLPLASIPKPVFEFCWDFGIEHALDRFRR